LQSAYKPQISHFCMAKCTIKIHLKTKRVLDSFRECLDESYDEVISRLINVAKNRSAPKLSKKAVKSIECARGRVKAGNFIDEKGVRERLKL